MKSKKLISNILFFFIIMLSFIITSQAHAQILFHENFENGIIPYLQPRTVWKPVNIDSGTIVQSQARNGRNSYRLTLNYDDNWGNDPSSELSLVKAGLKRFLLGNEYWISISIFLPIDFQKSDYTTLVSQFFGTPDTDIGEQWDRNPPFALMVSQEQWKIIVRADPAPVTIKGQHAVTKVLHLGAWTAGKWTDFIFHIKWSYNEDGILEIWKDGKLIKNYDGPNCYNDKNGTSFKIGPYEWAWRMGPNLTTKREIYYDEIKVGDATSSYSEIATPI